MSEEPVDRDEINPGRRFLFIFIIVASIGTCFAMLTVPGPAKTSWETVLRESGFISNATATKEPTSTATPLAAPPDRPTSTIAPTSQATPSTEDPRGGNEVLYSTEVLSSTEVPTPTQKIGVGNGRCLDPCNPASSNCLPGLNCVSRDGSADVYVCWNSIICMPKTPERTPDITCNFDGICDNSENTLCLDCIASWTPNVDLCANQTCGDGRCSPCQVDLTCAADCGLCSNSVCGDDVCRCGESANSCPADCGEPPCTCGDGQCRAACGETPATCRQDCGDPCAGSTCGDGQCRPACGERPNNCEVDCRLLP